MLAMNLGCSSFGDWGKAKEYVEWPLSRFAKDYQKPQRIAVIWSPDVMTVPGQAPMRGFGGRLYFYNEKSIAVPVKGELMIYGYEEPAPNVGLSTAKSPDKKTVPDKKFKFSPEQFAERFSKSDLGASYSIWIPWDEAGGNVKRVSLIPIFKLDDDQVVYGDPAELTLPGKTPQNSMAPPSLGGNGGAIQPFAPQQAMLMQPQSRQPASGYPPTIYPAGSPNSNSGLGYPSVAPSVPQNNPMPPGVSSANYNTQVLYPGAVGQAAFQGPYQPNALQQAGYQQTGYQQASAQPASFGQNNMSNGSIPSSGLKTTTIQLPPRAGNRLGQGNSTASPFPNAEMTNGQSVQALTPTAKTLLQMQSAGIDAQTQSALLGTAQPLASGQHGNVPQGANYGLSTSHDMNSNQTIQGVAPTMPAAATNAINSNSQLQPLPADFGPRKRQARAR
jgi:hypothetical protein